MQPKAGLGRQTEVHDYHVYCQKFSRMRKTVLFAALFGIGIANLLGQKPYFQQEVDYRISVKLDDVGHHLNGYAEFDYLNQSPDTLKELYIHLWPNAYKNNRTAFAKQKRAAGDLKIWFAKPEDRGWIDSLTFKVDGVETAWAEWNGNPDIAILQLPKPLLPGSRMTVTTPFHVKIPKSFSRLGHVEQQYQITQWYPKPAVYDPDGWHPIPYLDQGEFYSEFGSFDVKIDVPSAYVVGSTGDLQANSAEEKFIREREAFTRQHMPSDRDSFAFPAAHDAGARKVLHFKQEKVHDFAWFCDKEYFLLSDSVALPFSKEKVRTVAMFTAKDRQFWKNSPDYLNKSVYYYSLWNGDYPYHHATAVDGALSAGAGMEYPNITVVGAGGSASALEMVIMHEVGHNWFYGILATNERLHPWLDEGLNTYMEGRYWRELHDGKMEYLPDAVEKFIGFELTHSSMGRVALEMQQGQQSDQPVEFPAADYTPTNYGVITYMKTGLSFEYLEEYLGDSLIVACFRDYFQTWKFKHPQPKDIRASFEKTTKMDLGWFFEDYIRGTERVDFRAKKLKGNVLTVQNRSGIQLPLMVGLEDENGKVIEMVKVEPFEGETAVELPEVAFHKAVLNPGGFAPEFNSFNNIIREKGLFRKARTPEVHFLYKFQKPDKVVFNWLPVIGYNMTDGFMAGLLVHHNLFPSKKFDFYAMPMYGFKSGALTGAASFKYHWLPKKGFQRITLALNGASFSEFRRVRPELNFAFMPKRLNSDWRHSFRLAYVAAAFKESVSGDSLFPFNGFYPETLGYGELAWSTSFEESLHKFQVEAHAGQDFARQATRLDLAATYSRRYAKKLRFTVRGFAGMVVNGDNLPVTMGYGLSGSRDFQGQSILLDRYFGTGLLSRQLVGDQGGMNTLLGVFDSKGIYTLNFTHNIPYTPFRVFADVGKLSQSSTVFWDAGLGIGILKQSLGVNVPVAGTVFQDGFPSSASQWARSINFVADISQLARTINIGGQ